MQRPGGGAMIGREYVVRSPPDGYTLLLGSATLAALASLRPTAKMDVIRDFTPISLISNYPLVLVMHPSVPARSVKDLIALAKANPGKLNFGSSGAGQSPHLAAELFKSMAKVDIVHIPARLAATLLRGVRLIDRYLVVRLRPLRGVSLILLERIPRRSAYRNRKTMMQPKNIGGD